MALQNPPLNTPLLQLFVVVSLGKHGEACKAYIRAESPAMAIERAVQSQPIGRIVIGPTCAVPAPANSPRRS